MPIYKIANRTVFVETKSQLFKSRAKKYLLVDNISKDDCDIIISFEGEEYENFLKEKSEFSQDILDYSWASFNFYREILKYGGFFLHSSVVAVDDNAYAFSADSGTGKSTHTNLWLKHFGKDKAEIINDDKPAIMCENGKVIAYGTPFSGKHDISQNKGVVLKSLCFLERGEQNEIEQIPTSDAIKRLYSQIVFSDKEKYMCKLLELIDIMLSNVKVYRLKCTISDEAVEIAYNKMNKS